MQDVVVGIRARRPLRGETLETYVEVLIVAVTTI